MMKFAFIGRPNVGKSSLFNALLGYRRTIVWDEPGTTLDFVSEVPKKWGEKLLCLEDSQGIFGEGDEEVVANILQRADYCLFVVDAQVGVTPFDKWIATLIAKSEKPVLMLINKAEGNALSRVDEFSVLGFEDSMAVSAAHRQGLDEVRDFCLSHAKAAGEVSSIHDDKETVALALMGRPNSGKSSLMNKLCRQAVSRVSPIALTTRDTVSFEMETRQGRIRLLDTAGMRRPRADKTQIEEYSIAASTRALKECDVAVLMIDASAPMTDQDMRLLSLLDRQGKPTIILLNFWDKLTGEERRKYLKETDFENFISRFVMLPISAKTGWNIPKLLPLVFSMNQRANTRIKTSDLNRFVKNVVSRNPPPAAGNGNFNILYASQVKVDPPTFVFFLNRKGNLPDSYGRYLENQIQRHLGFKKQPVRVFFKAGERRERNH